MIKLMFTLFLTLNVEWNDCTKFDLIIVCDYSGSVKGYEEEIANSVNIFAKGLYIGENDTKLGIVVFSDYSEVFLPLTVDSIKIKGRLKDLYMVGSMTTTNLSSALLSSYEEFKLRGREDVKKIMLIISDGQPDQKIQTLEVANTLKLLNIEICTLLISSQTVDEGLMKQLSSPNLYFHTNYQDLLKTLQNINFCL